MNLIIENKTKRASLSPKAIANYSRICEYLYVWAGIGKDSQVTVRFTDKIKGNWWGLHQSNAIHPDMGKGHVHTITVKVAGRTDSQALETLCHEFVHARQTERGDLTYQYGAANKWSGRWAGRWAGDERMGKRGKHGNTKYWDRPWEIEARHIQTKLARVALIRFGHGCLGKRVTTDCIGDILRMLHTDKLGPEVTYDVRDVHGLSASATKHSAYWGMSNPGGQAAAAAGYKVRLSGGTLTITRA